MVDSGSRSLVNFGESLSFCFWFPIIFWMCDKLFKMQSRFHRLS